MKCSSTTTLVTHPTEQQTMASEPSSTPSGAELHNISDNIIVLSAISERIPKALASAGSAVALLTNSPQADNVLKTSPGTSNEDSTGLEARKEAFLAHVAAYYATVGAIKNSLNKQIDALEDAGILPIEKDQSDASGLGDLDVAYLNSQRRDVGVAKEQELRAEAEAWLKEAREITDEVMEEAKD